MSYKYLKNENTIQRNVVFCYKISKVIYYFFKEVLNEYFLAGSKLLFWLKLEN